jgi:hypothetical protein
VPARGTGNVSSLATLASVASALRRMMRVDRERLGPSVARASWLLGVSVRRCDEAARSCRSPQWSRGSNDDRLRIRLWTMVAMVHLGGGHRVGGALTRDPIDGGFLREHLPRGHLLGGREYWCRRCALPARSTRRLRTSAGAQFRRQAIDTHQPLRTIRVLSGTRAVSSPVG